MIEKIINHHTIQKISTSQRWNTLMVNRKHAYKNEACHEQECISKQIGNTSD